MVNQKSDEGFLSRAVVFSSEGSLPASHEGCVSRAVGFSGEGPLFIAGASDCGDLADADQEIGVPGAAKRWAERALALAASSSRLRGEAEVSSDCRRRMDALAISSMAAWNEASLALEGL
jgi:hypothetical protein